MKKSAKQLGMLLTVKGALLQKLFPGMMLITIITVILCYLHLEHQFSFLKVSNALPGYMGAALGLLLVFRNNTAYDKWWEARKELGALVNTARNFAICLNGFLPNHNEDKHKIGSLISTFVFVLKGHLRNNVDISEMKDLDPEDLKLVANAKHKPNVIANIMMARVEKIWKEKLISDLQQQTLVIKITGMVDILGKCERIKNTPIPVAYAFLLKFFIVLYVMILPFGLLDDLGWGAVPLVIVLYYIMMSIVLTAEEIEDPFGHDLNDLPMDDIAANIQRNVQEIIHHD
ncbi:MAG: bestrophin family protein [Cytophagaceae bacterium]|jgi:putative membrane protein|nr:bestrophin family protein [Cytophagaceae bacterium]